MTPAPSTTPTIPAKQTPVTPAPSTTPATPAPSTPTTPAKQTPVAPAPSTTPTTPATPAPSTPVKEVPKEDKVTETPKEDKVTPNQGKNSNGQASNVSKDNKPSTSTTAPQVDKKELTNQLKNSSRTVGSSSFAKASEENRQSYLNSISRAQEVVANGQSTQEDVNNVLNVLKESEEKVTDKTPEKSSNSDDKAKDQAKSEEKTNNDNKSEKKEEKSSDKESNNTLLYVGSGFLVLLLAGVLFRRRG